MADVLTGKGYAITTTNAAALTAAGGTIITLIDQEELTQN